MSAADTASAGTYTSMALMPTPDTRPGRRYASLPGSAAAASIIGSAATASDHTAELPASPLASAGGAGASGAGAGVMRRRRWLASAAGDERDGRNRPRGRACRLRSDRRYAEGRARWGRGGAPWGGSHRRGRNERRCRCGRAGTRPAKARRVPPSRIPAQWGLSDWSTARFHDHRSRAPLPPERGCHFSQTPRRQRGVATPRAPSTRL